MKGCADTRFFYDGDALVTEYDAAGAILNRYAHGSSAAADDPLVWFSGSTLTDKRHLHADRLGSIVAATNGASAPAINAYDEYGVPKSGNVGRFQYTGQVWLGEIGLYYYKARVYSPYLGRFLQVDPIGYDDQINLYAYVANDPINHTDPDGQVLQAIGGAIVGAGFEIGFQMVVEGKSWSEVDKTDVAITAAAGATGLGALKAADKFFRAEQKAVRAQRAAEKAQAMRQRVGQSRQQRLASQAQRAKDAASSAKKDAVKAAAAAAAVKAGEKAAQNVPRPKPQQKPDECWKCSEK